MITASRLELVARCEGHLTRRQVNEPNEWSEAGIRRHADDELAINAGDVPEIYTERWPGLLWRSEVRYAYDASDGTSEFCGLGSNRNYGAPAPFRIGGTVDVEGRGPSILVIVDKKSFEAVTPAASNPQIRFLALAAARVHPADRIFVAINHELHGLDVAELDPNFDLDLIAHDTKRLIVHSAEVRAAARAGQAVEFNVGRWCRWCPAFNDCPKQADLKALLSRDDDDPDLAMQTLLDNESAPDVYELWKRIGILHKRIGQSLYAHAASRPIPLSSGKMFGAVEKLGNEKLDGDMVYETIRRLHGQQLADAAVVRSATKKRLGEVLKRRRGAADEVIQVVRDAGGAERKRTTAIEEYDARPRLIP